MNQVKDKNSGIRLMGFGHRVYRSFDPRAKILKKAADDLLESLHQRPAAGRNQSWRSARSTTTTSSAASIPERRLLLGHHPACHRHPLNMLRCCSRSAGCRAGSPTGRSTQTRTGRSTSPPGLRRQPHHPWTPHASVSSAPRPGTWCAESLSSRTTVRGRCDTDEMLAYIFGPEESWPDQDLIGFSEEFDAGLVMAAYSSGVFPMPLNDSGFRGQMGWWSPVQRGVVELGRLRVSRSLRKTAKRYLTSIDLAFDQVIRRCADPGRPYGWIDDDIVSVYTQLHEAGQVHSVETWDAQGRLVGGLCGVSIGGLFAGSPCSTTPSTVGTPQGGVAAPGGGTARPARPHGTARRQWLTDHLASLGATGSATAVICVVWRPPWNGRTPSGRCPASR